MAALPTTSCTQTLVGLTSLGNKIYNVLWVGTGTGAGAEVTCTVTVNKLGRIKGTPSFAIVNNDMAAGVNYIVSTAVSGNVVTVTLKTDVGNGEIIWLSGEVIGI